MMLFFSYTQLWHWLLVAFGISLGAPPEYAFQVEAQVEAEVKVKVEAEVKGLIRDAESGEVVPYAHILVMGRGQGTAAGGEGRFMLSPFLFKDDGVPSRFRPFCFEWKKIKPEFIWVPALNMAPIP
jgi:hypothetical protein